MGIKKIRFLGIDPGLQKTGWGIVDLNLDRSFDYISSGIIKTTTKEKIADRLYYIFSKINHIIHEFLPNEVAIEDTYVNKNYQASLKLSHARAAIIIAVSHCKLMPKEYPAKTIKKTLVGTGTADKKQIIAMLKFWLPGVSTLTEDAADALALAICHANHYQANEAYNKVK